MNPPSTIHARAVEMFPDLVDERLRPGDASWLGGHLEGCADCRADWKAYAETVALVRGVSRLEAPASFSRRVQARVRRGRRRILADRLALLPAAPLLVTVPILLLAAAAVALLLLLHAGSSAP